MSSGFTGTSDPLPCSVLREQPIRNNLCYACFDGTFCNEDKSVCQDLTGCAIDGSATCGFFKSCAEDKSLTIANNVQTQYVMRCKTDALRVTIFVLGCILTTALVFMLGLIVKGHVDGVPTKFVDGKDMKKDAAAAGAGGGGGMPRLV